MAYNRTFNPDALPAFAEPERKHTSPTNSSFPARVSSSHSQAPAPAAAPGPARTPPISKPTPPIPGSYPRPSHSPTHPPPGATHLHHSPPPPQMASQGRFPSQQGAPRPPPSPVPASGGRDPTLLPLFRAVDKDGSGQLSEKELRAALVNGDWTSFDPHTVRMMIRMFDSDRSGTIGFEEFCGLWGFLAAWRTLFDRFDADRSGNISLDEFTNAMVAFGYRLSPQFIELMFTTYDKRAEGAISFDLFVQACISLKRMTDVFKKYDDDRDGFITLSFEDFLTEIIRQK